MLKRFEVRNYKNFSNPLVLDLGNVSGYQFNSNCILNSVVTKGLIYGRNAVGKTNLGNAINDIYVTTVGFPVYERDYIFNADSDESLTSFIYSFIFDDEEVVYEYSKNITGQLTNEKLTIGGVTLYHLDYLSKCFITNNLGVIDAESLQEDRFFEALYENENSEEGVITSLSFLRYLFNNSALSNDSTIKKLERFISGMRLINATSRPNPLVNSILRRTDYLSDDQNLAEFERFLNKAGIKCKLTILELPDGTKKLYSIHKRNIPFLETASSGTLSLVNLYFRLVSIRRGLSFIFYDEFDAFYHYELSAYIVEFLKEKYPSTQILLTTHNTNLMNNQYMRPDCLFILSSRGNLTPLCDATERELREGHNLEKLYIAGEFRAYE